MDRAQKPLLIAFLGSIGVGKSYFAKQLAAKIGAVRLNADAARLAMFGSLDEVKKLQQASKDDSNIRLFGVVDYAVEEILASGVSVVYDTARYNGADNRRVLKTIADTTHADLVYVWVETPREVARARVLNRQETRDQRRLEGEVAEKIFEFHDEHFNAPTSDEVVIKISGEVPFEAQYKDFTQQLYEQTGRHDGK